MARPTKYTDETIPKTREYLEKYSELGHMIPSIAGLAVYLGVSRETIRDWGHQEDKRQFSGILQELLATQEQLLVSSGLKGEFNPTITKLVLGKHNYHDKVDQDVTTGGEKLSLNVKFTD